MCPLVQQCPLFLFPGRIACHNSISALLGFVHFLGGVSVPEWHDCHPLLLAVANIILGSLTK